MPSPQRRGGVRRIRIAALVFFFLLTSFFALYRPSNLFSWPDETANMFFIRELAEYGRLRVPESLNVAAEDLVHPRSIRIVDHDLAPVSFVGLLLIFGAIASVFGMWIVPLLTPIIATVSVLAFERLVAAFFGERVGRWSFFLLLVHPVWIYYTSRSLLPNVSFLSFLIFGAAFVLNRHFLFAGLSVGVALTIRPSEGIWVASAFAIAAFLHRSSLRPRDILHFVLALIVPLIPFFAVNMLVYGHPLASGYARADDLALTPALTGWHLGLPWLDRLLSFVLPFGIVPDVLARNFMGYILTLFWWFAIPSFLGVALAWRSPKTRLPAMLFSVAALLVVFFYGSWAFRDSTLAGATIGTSYVRYWLPVYIFGIPFAVTALFALVRSSRMQLGCAILVALWSIRVVLVGSAEGLIPIAHTLRAGAVIQQTILAETEPIAVILTERWDKYAFPHRRVIVDDTFDAPKIHRLLGSLVGTVPLYYLTPLLPADIAFMNEKRLAQYGVAWEYQSVVGNQTMYVLKKQ